MLDTQAIVHPAFPGATVRTPLIVKLGAADRAAYLNEWFGPIAFVIGTESTEESLAIARDTVRGHGALTLSIYSMNDDVIDEAIDVAEDAGVALSINLTGGVFVNQSAAYSDFHGTGANPGWFGDLLRLLMSGLSLRIDEKPPRIFEITATRKKTPAADSTLVVNEMAPRPHNSGHYTIDACDVSQFELQVRTLCDLPLTQPRQHSPSIMLNILGDVWFSNGSTESQTPPWDQILALPGAHLHLYGKKDAKKGRKMGHLTLTGATVEVVKATTAKAAQILGIEKY